MELVITYLISSRKTNQVPKANVNFVTAASSSANTTLSKFGVGQNRSKITETLNKPPNEFHNLLPLLFFINETNRVLCMVLAEAEETIVLIETDWQSEVGRYSNVETTAY